jgi:hypothetical protein
MVPASRGVTSAAFLISAADVARFDVTVSGGDRTAAYLKELAAKMKAGEVRVGFLERATYPAAPGQPTLHVAQVAFWNNFGTSRAPARPFFSNTVKTKSPGWGEDMAKIAKAVNYDTAQVLKLMGERIKDQIVTAIVQWPADNAPSTVERKGFNKGLVDRGVMQRNVDYDTKVES